MEKLTEIVEKLGLDEKEAKIYLATLELGEATVQHIAAKAKLKRTTLYYILEKLKRDGVLLETKRRKHIYYIPASPRELLKRAREKLWEVEESIDSIEAQKHAIYKKPRLYFLYGPSGFKHIWDMIFASPEKEFKIITEGENFLDFVKEKYILDEIIKTKKKLGISSKQLIADSPYARKIIAKDRQENRVSKIIPSHYKLPFTEVISHDFVAFISPRWDNTLFVVENERFAQTRNSVFEITWNSLK